MEYVHQSFPFFFGKLIFLTVSSRLASPISFCFSWEVYNSSGVGLFQDQIERIKYFIKKSQLYFFFITALDLAVVFRKINLYSLHFSVLFSLQSKNDFPDSINTKSRTGSLPEKHASKHHLLWYKSDTIPRKKKIRTSLQDTSSYVGLVE